MNAPPTVFQKVKGITEDRVGEVFEIREGQDGTEIRVKYPDGSIAKFASVRWYTEVKK